MPYKRVDCNGDVPDLESRIAEHIGPAISYACIYWGDHLQHVAFRSRYCQETRITLRDIVPVLAGSA